MQLYKSFLLLLSTSITAVSGVLTVQRQSLKQMRDRKKQRESLKTNSGSVQHIRHGKLGREELLRKRRGLAPSAREAHAARKQVASDISFVDRSQTAREAQTAREYLQKLLSGQPRDSIPTWFLLNWLLEIVDGKTPLGYQKICFVDKQQYTVVEYLRNLVKTHQLPSDISSSITRFLINFCGQKIAKFLFEELQNTNGTMLLSDNEKLEDEDFTLGLLSKIYTGQIAIDAKINCFGRKLDILEYVQSNSCQFSDTTKNNISRILTPFFDIFRIPLEGASMEESD